jgi:hypothetical protein
VIGTARVLVQRYNPERVFCTFSHALRDWLSASIAITAELASPSPTYCFRCGHGFNELNPGSFWSAMLWDILILRPRAAELRFFTNQEWGL